MVESIQTLTAQLNLSTFSFSFQRLLMEQQYLWNPAPVRSKKCLIVTELLVWAEGILFDMAITCIIRYEIDPFQRTYSRSTPKTGVALFPAVGDI